MDAQIRYFCYLRKSTTNKDRQAVSIPSQESELKPQIERESLQVIDFLRESFSAKLRGQRKIFNSMVKRIESGEANGILLWNINRLSRNAGDTGIVIDLMDRGLLIEIKTPGQVFRNNPQDKFLLILFSGQAKLENDSKAVDVKRGLKKKAELGWRPANPITGYIGKTDKYRGLIGIDPDPTTFSIVKSFFKRLLKEESTISQLYLEACDKYQLQCTTKRNIISRTAFYSIFRNTFYYGEFEWPANSGKWYRGKHKPMITKSEFSRLQEILDQRVNPKRIRPKESLPYKKLFRCGECSMSITGSHVFKRQVSGKVHEYKFYHCTKKSKLTKCSQKVIRQEEIDLAVEKLLGNIWLPPEVIRWSLKKSQDDILEKENIEQVNRVDALQKKLDNLSERYDKLIDMRADNEIDSDTFAEKTAHLKSKIKSLEVSVSDHSRNDESYILSLKQEYGFISSALKLFQNGNKSAKRAIIKRIGSNRYIIDRKLVIEPKMELVAIKKMKTRLQRRMVKFKPLSSLNKRTLDTLHAESPIQRGRLY